MKLQIQIKMYAKNVTVGHVQKYIDVTKMDVKKEML